MEVENNCVTFGNTKFRGEYNITFTVSSSTDSNWFGLMSIEDAKELAQELHEAITRTEEKIMALRNKRDSENYLPIPIPLSRSDHPIHD